MLSRLVATANEFGRAEEGAYCFFSLSGEFFPSANVVRLVILDSVRACGTRDVSCSLKWRMETKKRGKRVEIQVGEERELEQRESQTSSIASVCLRH